ncbi:MAG: hypothetical protein U0R27_14120 [Candidatus Nanopelagicales bacterium]
MLISIDWSRQVAEETIDEVVARNYLRDVEWFLGWAGGRDCSELRDLDADLVLEWLHSPLPNGRPAAENTRGQRLSAMRALFNTCKKLGLWDVNPAATIHEYKPVERTVAPFSEDQIRQLKRVAAKRPTSTRRPAMLALILCGASLREAAAATIGDVDVANARVWLQGGSGWYEDRWVPIDDAWALEALTSRVNALRVLHASDSEVLSIPLVYRPRKAQPGKNNGAASLGVCLTKLMREARIYLPGRYRVESIREYVACRVFDETGSLEKAAVRLGTSSLDGIAHIVGYDWAATQRLTFPPPSHRSVS